MKFTIPRNLKFLVILIVIFTLINFTLSSNQYDMRNIGKCSIINQNRIQEELRDDYTRKIIFFVFITYFYTNFL